MNQSNLILHTGARTVEREQFARVVTPERTVYFDSGTALGFLAVRCDPCLPRHRAILCAGLLSPWCRACEAGPSLHRVGEAGMFVLAIIPRRVDS